MQDDLVGWITHLMAQSHMPGHTELESFSYLVEPRQIDAELDSGPASECCYVIFFKMWMIAI